LRDEGVNIACGDGREKWAVGTHCVQEFTQRGTHGRDLWCCGCGCCGGGAVGEGAESMAACLFGFCCWGGDCAIEEDGFGESEEFGDVVVGLCVEW